MDNEIFNAEKIPTIKDLYPQLTEEQQKEAEESLMRYLEVVLRIFNRLEAEGNATGSEPLTNKCENTNIDRKNSDPA